MPGLRNQAGRMHFITGGVVNEDTWTISGSCLSWNSGRIKRVLRSTFAAETLAAAEPVDSTVHAKAMVSWTLYGEIFPGRPKAVHVTDCCSLVQHLRNLTPKCVEKRIAIDKMAFREMISSKVIEGILWRDTKVQLADSLTKLMNAEHLYHSLEGGKIDLVNPPKLSSHKRSDSEKGAVDEVGIGLCHGFRGW